MAFVVDDWEYQPAGTRDAAKTNTFFDSIKALITPPKMAAPSGPPPPSSGIWDNGNEWVDNSAGGHWRAADGKIWSNTANSWVEDPTAAIAAVSRVGNAITPVAPEPTPVDPMQQWLTTPNEGRAGSQFDRMGFQEAPTNAGLLGYYADQEARQQTLSQILGFANKAAGATNFYSPEQRAFNSAQEDPTGWNGQPKNAFGNDLATNRDPGLGLSQILKAGGSAYGTLDRNLLRPFEETAAQLTGPFYSALEKTIPGTAALRTGATQLQGKVGLPQLGAPDPTGGLVELGGSIRESGGNPLDFRDIQNRKFEERPVAQQVGASIAYDPTNLAGMGLGGAALKSGAVTSKIGRGLATADKALDVAQAKAALPLIGGLVGYGASAASGGDTKQNLLWGLTGAAGAAVLPKSARALLPGGLDEDALMPVGAMGAGLPGNVGRQGDMFGGSVPNPHLAGITPEAEAARQQLLGNLQQNRIIRKAGTTGDEIATGRTRQVAGILGGLTEGEAAGLTGRQLLDSMANGIQGGPLIQTTAGPLQLTPDIQDDMADIVTAWVKQDPAGRAYEARTARDVLDKIYAGRMPEPKEDELLRRIFGNDVTDAISGAKKVKVEKVDNEATSYPLDLGDQTVATQPPLFGDTSMHIAAALTPEQIARRDEIIAKQTLDRTAREQTELEQLLEQDRQFLERARNAGGSGPALSFKDEALIGAQPVRGPYTVEDGRRFIDELQAERARQFDELVQRSGETGGTPLGMEPQPTQLSLYEAKPVTGTFPATGEVIQPHSVTPKKILEMAKIAGLEIISAPRALKSSLDLSAPLRQGAILGWRFPKLAKEAFAAQLQAWGSEEAARAIDKALDARPNARIHRESGLYRASLNSMDDGLTAQEEVFVSRFADKLPYVKNSERAYATYLNKLRADSFDAIWNSLPELEKTSQRAKDLASFINVASGRGELTGRLAGSGPLLGTVLYAPRYLVSRPQAVWMAATKAGIRGEASKALASYAAGTGTILALGNAAGLWDVELDPRSSDFGKARIGPLRYDLWTGYSQLGRVMTQFSLAALEPLDGKGGIRIPNASKSTETGDTRDIGAGEPLSRFVRSKLAPGTGFLTNLVTQKDYRGSPYDPSIDVPGLNKKFDTGIGALVELAGPLSPTDFIKAWNDYGWEMALATLPSFVGAGASAFDPTPIDALDKIAKQTEYADKDGNIVKGAKFYDLPAGTQARIREENPELAKQLDDSKTSPEAKANIAATRILMEQQAKADTALEKKDLHPKEWREQLGARQTELITRKDQIYINAGKKPGSDPVLDGYFASIKKATDELGQVDWGLVDAFRAGLSDSENKYLDENTGLSLGTPTVKAYRADMDAIKNSGYWDIYDRAWSMYQEKYAEHPTSQFASYQDWYNSQVKTAQDALLADGTFKPGEEVAALDAARGIVNKTGTAKAFTSTKDALKEDWVARHKEDGIAKKAFEWEYITADKYRKFLYGN